MLLRVPGHAVIWVATLAVVSSPRGVGPAPAQPGASVSGRISVVERGNRQASDVGSAVLWLDSPGARAPAPRTVDIITEGKEFRPRVTVIPLGSTVNFPNNDPFNHNVFSVSQEAMFDLGLFGRRQSKSVTFSQPGIIRVFCNVHAGMAAFVVVRENAWFTQPEGDGSFTIPAVAPGKYLLHAWHERATAVAQPIEVGARGRTDLALELDARGYKFVQHLNKFGQPYSRGGARY
jgi:plastocyanin